MLRQKPRPGAWRIRSRLLSSWREKLVASPRMKRRSSRRNSPSAWSGLMLGWRQLAFSRSGEALNSMWLISDIQRCILSAIYHSQLGEWILVTILPLIFLNGYISPMWKRKINLAPTPIESNGCSSTMTGVLVLTIWRRHCHILHSKAGTILTLQRFSKYFPLLINGEVHAEPICYVSRPFRMSPLFALYHSRYIIWEKPMSAECAEVSN